MEVAPDLLLKEWLALPDSLGFDGQVVADHESVFDVHINVSSERTAARARPTFLRLRARRFFKHPMAFSTFDSHVLAVAFYRSRGRTHQWTGLRKGTVLQLPGWSLGRENRRWLWMRRNL